MTTLPLEEQICKQVEFYFSDSNYPRDKFLRGQAELSPLGFVKLDLIASFTRMKKLTMDKSVIVKALKEHKSTIIELSDDGTEIRRCMPLPEEDYITEKTIYAKKFPLTHSMDQIQQYFQPYGNVMAVRLRRNLARNFKGSVFVEFNTIEEAKKVAGMNLVFSDAPLIMMMKKDYVEKKKEEYKQKKELRRKKNDNKDGKEGEMEIEVTYTPGTILKFNDIGSNQTRETLKIIFSAFGKVVYIDFSKNLNEGYVRYTTPEECTKSYTELTNNKTPIGDKVPILTVITGDEEKEYWIKVNKNKIEKRQPTKKKTKKAKAKAKAKIAPKTKTRGEKRPREESDDVEDQPATSSAASTVSAGGFVSAANLLRSTTSAASTVDDASVASTTSVPSTTSVASTAGDASAPALVVKKNKNKRAKIEK